MDDSKDPPPSSDWQKKSMERRGQIRREFRKLDEPQWHWKDSNDDYFKDRKSFIEECQGYLNRRHQEILENIENGKYVKASDSNDRQLRELQDVIDTMARRSGLLEPPPSLIIEMSGSKKPVGSAQVTVKDFIEIDVASKNYYLQHQDEFKAVMAHEMGHIYNSDRSAEGQAIWLITPANQAKEILADRVGAIIHGNPKEYAIASSKNTFAITKMPHEMYTSRYLSANGRERMTHKWAKILEYKGATDEKGDVIMEKALKVFERSKEFTEGLLHQSLNWGISHPPSQSR